MNRRAFLVALPAVSAALAVEARPAMESVPSAAVQDLEYMRALERAQRERPRVLSSRARIAPVGEPSTPLVIHGRLFQRDGRTPARGVCIFAYHTDRTGIYAEPSKGPHVWRLRGWAETDAEGRFQFDTIRPAPYPSRAMAAHVHLSIEDPRVPRQSFGVLFADDPLVSASEREASTREGLFGSVLAVEVRDGVQHVTVNLKIEDRGRF